MGGPRAWGMSGLRIPTTCRHCESRLSRSSVLLREVDRRQGRIVTLCFIWQLVQCVASANCIALPIQFPICFQTPRGAALCNRFALMYSQRGVHSCVLFSEH